MGEQRRRASPAAARGGAESRHGGPVHSQEAERALRESRKRYAALFGQMLEGVAYCQMLFDEGGQPADWIYIEVNPAFEELTGLRHVAGKRVTQLISGVRETNPELFAIYGRVVRTGVPEQFETYLPALERWFLVKVYRPQAGHFAAVFENVTERKRLDEALRESAQHYRDVVENLAEGVVVQDADGRVVTANAAAGAILGREVDEIIGATSFDPAWGALWAEGEAATGEDRPTTPVRLADEPVRDVTLGVRHSSGATRWVTVNSKPLRHLSGELVAGAVVSFSDVTESRRIKEALQASEALLRGSLDALADPFMICSPMRDAEGEIVEFRVAFANRAAGAFIGRAPESLIGAVIPDRMPHLRGRPYRDVFREVVRTGVPWTEDSVEFVVPGPDGTDVVRLVDLEVAAFGDGLFAAGRDVTERQKLAAERDRLAAAVEQAAESIVITDLDARITYVNPAFERMTGYSRGEVIGENPRILKSGLQPPSFYQAMWAALANGVPWTADFVNRRKDGSFFTEETVISPIRDASGAVTGYLSVKHDVTRERALVERSTEISRERALISETIRRLYTAETADAKAQAICRQVASLTGVVAAQLLLFEPDGYAVPIGLAVAGQADPPLQRLSYHRSRQLRGRAAEGPWIEPWANRMEHPEDQPLKGVGVRSLAHAPVRYDEQVIGLLTVQASDAIEQPDIAENLPAIVEFADLAGALIGRDVVQRTEAGRSRGHISAILAHRAFRPLFQPIIDLTTNTPVGYEALTRFTDLSDPGPAFAEAAAVGLGVELETATLRAALAAAGNLPRSMWLNLNTSPELILSVEPLRSIVRASRRRIVLEVTEHTAIADYPAFRAAVEALGPKVQLAVDDAGAGFASLRHILELSPAFVKLDRWLVTDLEGDDARQAMIVGLIHFSRATGCRLIAEGIETESELALVRSMGIRLGQGYLLGRPDSSFGAASGAPHAGDNDRPADSGPGLEKGSPA
jgi:PAS domain S-box-containing protein